MEGLSVAFGIVIVLVVLIHQRWSVRAAGWRQNRLCSRCGAEFDRIRGGDGPFTMCVDCLKVTERNYRLGAWFFYGLAALMAAAMPWGVWREVNTFGVAMGAQMAGILLGLIGVLVAAGWGINHLANRLR